jgi:hypothetical protein
LTRGSEFPTLRPKWVEYCSKRFIIRNKRNLPAMRLFRLGTGGGKCRYTNINAANVEIYLKSWFLIQIKRGDLYALPAGIRIPAGSCPRFPVGLPLELETWESARPRLVVPPPAASPELLSLYSREL